MGRPKAKVRRAGLLVSAAVVCLLGSAWSAPPAAACQPAGPEMLVPSASAPGVTAVVEHVVVASNPLPWGRSALLVSRVWGGALVERWTVSDRRWHACPDLEAVSPGTHLYTFPGAGLQEVARPGPVSGLEAAALAARLGPPRSFPVSSLDRLMGWVRIAPSLVLLVLVAAVLAVLSLASRRRRRRDRYLF